MNQTSADVKSYPSSKLNSIPRVGVAVVVAKEDQILLGKRKGSHGAGTWATPGGHLEYGETVEECAKRELFEETGLQTSSITPGPWTEDMIGGKNGKHYITIFVYATVNEGEPKLLEPHKCEGWEWFPKSSLPSPLFPSVISFLEKIGLEAPL